ncbi:zinc-binding protein A33 [Kryptolebias marmoratus]|uniref:zinc-binding protein A33 n=1 Tax=Kryptolebias marmoratus TaxID=37003 RepID=UPI0007F91A6A|nr:zinc-binding protein A33 [Kryptolebias marmoratus]
MLKRKIHKENLYCPQCSDIYSLPVTLKCRHNICRACLYQFWEVKNSRSCPVCGIESSSGMPPINLDLQKAVQVFKEQETTEEQEECSLHHEKLKVFCNVDEEPICLICQISQQHTKHKCCPVDEASRTNKVEMSNLLEGLKKKVKLMTKTKQQWEETKTYLKTQSSQIEAKIKEEFKKLHQFLSDEERLRLMALKQEEETKTQIMADKIKSIGENIRYLSSTIGDIGKVLLEKDLPFLKAYKETKKKAKAPIPEPESIKDILLNSSKHLGLLDYEVWNKMLNIVKYSPVILDPNTAHANLMLSQGLTSVQYSNKAILPDNPERCTSRMCVLGADGFTSGKHRWTVDVGQGKDWFVGVAQESIKRKSAVFFSPVEGFWVIGYCSKDSVWAQNATRARVSVKHYPEKITVELNYDKGRVVFINNADSSVIYTFKEKFSEKLFPYISVGLCDDWKKATPLTICPMTLKVQKE